jgi:hypothetical protein
LDEDFEMIAVEVKDMDPKYTWEILGIYRAPCEDMRLIERLAARTGFSRNPTKRSIIGGDLNLPQADWNGKTEGASGTQAFLNRLVGEHDITQVIGSPTRGNALLDVYLVLHDNSFVTCSIVQRISDQCVVLFDVEWGEICHVPHVED